MTMMKRLLLISAAAGVSLLVMVCAGCEKTTTGIVIVLTPPDADIDVSSAVTFTASIPAADSATRTLYYPLEWSVSKTGLGTIQQSAGNTAVYVAGKTEGVNTVTVRDQMGAEGVASVSQTSP